MWKGLKEKKKFHLFPLCCSHRNTFFFVSVDCLDITLQSFGQVGVAMEKEGTGSFPRDVRGTAASLAGLLNAFRYTSVRQLEMRDKLPLRVSDQPDAHLQCRVVSYLLWSQWRVCIRVQMWAPYICNESSDVTCHMCSWTQSYFLCCLRHTSVFLHGIL